MIRAEHAAEKRLDEMDRLDDMLHFPAVVNAGATVNVLLTVAITWFVEPRYALLAGPWVALVLVLNLLPVVLLRFSLGPRTAYPTLQSMNFFTDQHKFSDWVYVAASANMAFWVLSAWTLSVLHRSTGTLVCLEAVAFLATFSPVILRSVGMLRR